MNSEHNEDPPKIVDNSYSKVFCRRFGTIPTALLQPLLSLILHSGQFEKKRPNIMQLCVCLFKDRIAPLPHESNPYLQSSPD